MVKKAGREDDIQHNACNFLCTYRNVPHTVTGRSPAEIIFGRAPRTHLSMVLPNTAERLKSYLSPSENFQAMRKFQTGDSVWVRDYRPNATKKWTKGKIVTPVGTLTYDVHVEGSNNRKVHVDHLLNRVPKVISKIVKAPPLTPDTGSRDEMGPVTSEETTELSVTQQEDTTLPVSLHDSDARVIEPSTMAGSQIASPANAPTVEISSATDPEGLQPTEPARSQDSTNQQSLCKSIRQIKRPRRLVEEMN